VPDFPWGFDTDEAPDYEELPGTGDGPRTISTTDPDEDGIDMDA